MGAPGASNFDAVTLGNRAQIRHTFNNGRCPDQSGRGVRIRPWRWLGLSGQTAVPVTAVAARLFFVPLDLIANQAAYRCAPNGAHRATAAENRACDPADDGPGCRAFFATRHVAAGA